MHCWRAHSLSDLLLCIDQGVLLHFGRQGTELSICRWRLNMCTLDHASKRLPSFQHC